MPEQPSKEVEEVGSSPEGDQPRRLFTHEGVNTTIALIGCGLALLVGWYTYSSNSRLTSAEVLGRLHLAEQHLKENDLASAKREVAQALTRQPGNALALLYQGRVLETAGNESGAISLYRKALQEDRQLQPAYFFLGKALVASNDEGSADEAREHLDRAQELLGRRSTHGLNVPIADVLVEKGMALLKNEALPKSERIEKAKTACFEARERDPDDGDSSLCLGHVYSFAGQPRVALSHFEEAVQQAPRDPRILATVGWVYFHEEEYEKAEELLARTLRLHRDQETEDHYLVVLKDSGQEEAYSEALERYRANRPLVAPLADQAGKK